MSEKEKKAEEKLEENSKMEIIRSSKFLSLLEITEKENSLLQEPEETTEESKEKMDQSPTEDKIEEQNKGKKEISKQEIQKQQQDKKKERERKTRDKNRDRREEIRAERKKRLRRNIEKKGCDTCKAKYETNQKDVECVKCFNWIRMEIIVKN